MQTPDALTDLFRANGRKITAQRQCIFRALEGDVTHPSAERVHERVRTEMPNVSLKTVYQTLNDLADLGAIAMLDIGTGSARFDPEAPIEGCSLPGHGRSTRNQPTNQGGRSPSRPFDSP